MVPLLDKNLISTKDASLYSGYTSDYISRLCRLREVRCVRVGRAWLIEKDSLDSFMQSQGRKKAERADQLAEEREAEYRVSRSFGKRVEKTVMPALDASLEKLGARVILPRRFSSHAMALMTAFAVLAGGAYVAQADVLYGTLAHVRETLTQTVVGAQYIAEDFGATLTRSFHDTARALAAHERSRVITSASDIALADPFAFVAQDAVRRYAPQNLFASFGNASAFSTTAEVSTGANDLPFSRADIAAFISAASFVGAHPREFAFATEKIIARAPVVLTRIALRASGAIENAYLATVARTAAATLSVGATLRDAAYRAPADSYATLVALGDAVKDATRGIIGTYESDVYAYANWSPQFVDRVAFNTYALGNSLAQLSAAILPAARHTYVASAFALARALPMALNASVRSEIALGDALQSAASAVLAFHERAAYAAGNLAYSGAVYAANIPTFAANASRSAFISAEDALLGAEGSTALAFENLSRAASVGASRALSSAGDTLAASVASATAFVPHSVYRAGEQTALFTYRTLHGIFRATSDAIADAFFGAPPTYVTPVIPKSFHTVATATTTPSRVIESHPTYTTVVRGVSEGDLQSSLSLLRADVMSQVALMLGGVSSQIAANNGTLTRSIIFQAATPVNVVNSSDIQNSNFFNGKTVSSNSGQFTLLSSTGTTTLGATNVSGAFSISGAGSIGGDLSVGGALSVAGTTTLATTTLGATTIAGDLSVSGTITPAIISAGTSISAPYFIATSSSATSTFAGSLAVDGNGFVYATSTKNVGIGVLSPAALLAIKNSTSTQPIFVASNAAGTEVYRITNAGFVGIGSSTPTYALSVEGSSSLGNQARAGYFTATSSTATSTFAGALAVGTSTAFTNGLLAVGTTTSPFLFVHSTTGRIGIGTSSPAVAFDIFATDALRIPVGTSVQRPAVGDVGYVRYNTTTHQFEGFGDNAVWQGLGGVIDANQDTKITADTNNINEDTLRFFTRGAERLTIGPNGLIGVASTSPFAAFAIHLPTSASTTVAFAIASSTASATSTLFQIDNAGNVNAYATNATTTIAGGLRAAGASGLSVLQNGVVGIGTTSPSATFAVAGNAFISGGATTTSFFATLAHATTGIVDVLSSAAATFTGFVATNATTTNATTTGSFALTSATPSRLLSLGALGVASSTSLSSWLAGTANQVTITDNGVGGVTASLPSLLLLSYASTTALSAYTALSVGQTATSSITGDYGASNIRGALTVFGNTTSGSASSLAIQRGSTNGDNALTFNDQTGATLLKLSTSANSGHAILSGFQSFLDLGTSVGGTALSIDTSHNVNATANLIPTANVTYNLGSPADFWSNAYLNNIVANNLSSASTSIAGTNNSSFSIDSNNPTTDTQDISLVFFRGAGAPSNAVLSWDSTNKRFNFNQNAYFTDATASTGSTTLSIAAVAGQTAALTSWLNSAGATLGTFTAGGLFGLGTSSPTYKLSVEGTSSLGNQAFAGFFTATSTTATSTFAGGFAAGLCVTGDTKLRRRRRRTDGEEPDPEKGEAADDDYIYDEVAIKDIKEGDEIQSLDEKTGALVWRRVKKLAFMGRKQTYRLTTASGRAIRTTANHPYLARKGRSGTTSVPDLGRVFAFIDASNLYYGTRENDYRIDFRKFAHYLRTRYGVSRTFYYTGLNVQSLEQLGFYAQLEQYGYEVRYVMYKAFGDGDDKADVDARMATDLLTYADIYDRAVVITGDGDFFWTLQHLMRSGKEVKLFGYATRTARELKRLLGGKFVDFTRLHGAISLVEETHAADAVKGSAAGSTRTSPLYSAVYELSMMLKRGVNKSEVRGKRREVEKLLNALLYGFETEKAETTFVSASGEVPEEYTRRGYLSSTGTVAVDNAARTGAEPVRGACGERVESGEGSWLKVAQLKEGMEIATAPLRTPDSGLRTPEWDRIVSVEPVAEEDVYDVEIEGTHNFIGNDIVAHNTAFFSSDAFGNASVGGTLSVTGASTFTGLASFGNSSTTLASVASGLYNTYLTSGRVPYTTTAGLLTDSANLLFNGTTLTANALTLTTALPVSSGGTGATTFTSGNLIYGAGTGALQSVATSSLATGTGLTVSSGSLGYQVGGTAATLALANTAVTASSYGSSTAIPSFTVDAQGRLTAASTNAVIAPAGTLTGTTLAANVVSSSLTSVGTLTSGVWNGTTIALASGGTGTTTAPVSQLLYGGSTAYQSVATSSLTLGSEFANSGTTGALVGGTNGTLTLATNGTALTKLAQIAGNSILGNNTGGLGNVVAFATSTLGIALGDTTGTLAVARGGTGATTFTSGNLIYGAGTGALQSVATSSLSAGTGISFTGTAGALVGGTALTVALSNVGTAGTYRSVTTDAQGRVTAGTNPTTFAGYGLSDTSANLAAALTDETGTGAAVFATSPTLTTPNLGTPSALTLTNASGLLPAGVNLTKGNFLVGNDSGIAQATSTIFISSTGNVGIGTTTPSEKLDIASTGVSGGANLRLYNNFDSGYGDQTSIKFNAETNGAGNNNSALAQIVAGESSTPFATNYLDFKVGAWNNNNSVGSSLVRILSGGNVGIGTTSPYKTLSVAGTAVFDSQVTFPNGSAAAPSISFANSPASGMYRGGGDRINWATGGVARLSLDSAGTFEIGGVAANLTANFLQNTSNVNYWEFNGGTTGVAPQITARGTDAAVSLAIQSKGTGSIQLNPSGGNVGIGTTSPYRALSVAGSGVFTGGDVLTSTLTATSSITAASLALTNALTVSNGGTGATTFTSGNLIYGAGTGALQSVATSSLSAGTGISFTGTAGALVGGTALTVALSNVGTAGTYRSVTTDAQGRVTAGTNPTTFAGYGLSDTSANLAAALTDETGTGAAVFATSPTLTTPNLGTPSALTLTNASGLLPAGVNLTKGNFLVGNDSGIAQATSTIFISSTGNVGIGTTTPGAFLHVLGTTEQLRVGYDQNNYTSFTAKSNGDFLVKPSSSGSVYFGTYGASNDAHFDDLGGLTLNSSNNTTFTGTGSVGIGTTTPGSRLSISGSASIGADYTVAAPTNGLIVEGTTYIGSQVQQFAGAKLAVTDSQATNASTLAITNTNLSGSRRAQLIFSNGSGGLSIFEDNITGWFGWNTNSNLLPPTSGISYVDPVSATDNLGLTTANNGSITATTNGTGKVNLNNTFYALNTGNVGIGTASPGAKLVIKSGNADQIRLDNDGSQYTEQDFYNNGTLKTAYYYDNTAAQFIMRTTVAADIGFDTNLTRRMTILSTGNVGIGTTGPNQKLVVSGNGTFDNTTSGATQLRLSHVGSAADAGLLADDGSGSQIFSLTRQANNTASLSAYGDVGLAAGATGGPSTNYGLILKSTGNVGIGTTTPGVKFVVQGTMEQWIDNSTNWKQVQRNSGLIGFLGNRNDYFLNFDTVDERVGIGPNAGTPANVLSVDAGTSIGTGYYTTTAPSNGLIVQGNVGIGTTTPASKLTISTGHADPSSSTYTGGLTLGDMSGFTNSQLEVGSANSSPFGIWMQTKVGGSLPGTYPLSLQPLGGNVGIGTAGPGYKLEVNGTTGLDGNVTGTTDNTFFGWDAGSNRIGFTKKAGFLGQLAYGSAATFAITQSSGTTVDPSNTFTNRLTLDSSGNMSVNSGQLYVQQSTGNVGIGTTTPSTNLDIYNPTGAGGADLLKLEGLSNSGLVGLKFTTIAGDTAALRSKYTIPASSTATELQFYTNPSGGNNNLTQRMVIDGSGNVGIGTTGPLSKLDVNGGVAVGTYAGVNAAPANGLIVSGRIGVATTTPDEALVVNGNIVVGSVPSSVNRVKIDGTDFISPAIFGITTGGAVANLLFNPSGGNVGIGTTTPRTQLEVSGISAGFSAITLGSGVGLAGNRDWAINANGQTTGNLDFQVGASAGNTPIGTTPVLSLTSTRNVGIGTTGPLSKLDVNGGVAVGTYAGANAAPANGLIVSGNVGIGTASPSQKLSVSGSEHISSYDVASNPLPALSTSLVAGEIHAAVGDSDTSDNGVLRLSAGGGTTLGVKTAIDIMRGGTNASQIDFYTSGAQKMMIDSSGNVGIGTAGPSYKLDVNGTINTTGLQTSGTPSLTFSASKWMTQQETSSISRTYYVGPDTSTYGQWEIYRAKSNGSPSLVMTMDASGNVGIGTASPLVPLMLGYNTSSNSTSTIAIANSSISNRGTYLSYDDFGSASFGAYLAANADRATSQSTEIAHFTNSQLIRLGLNSVDASSGIGFYTDSGLTAGTTFTPTQRMIITNSGNVGIGTTTPNAKLTITDATSGYNSEVGNLQINNSSNPLQRMYLGYDTALGANGSGYIQAEQKNAAWTPLLLNPNGGNVGIGTTGPTAKLDTAGTIRSTTQTSPTSGVGLELFYDSAVGNAGILGYDRTGAAYKDVYIRSASSFLVGSTGNVGIGTTSPATLLEIGGSTNNITFDGYKSCTGYTSNANGLVACTASDQRLKQNIVALDGADGLNAINALNPVSFYWKPETGRGSQQQYGLIAQDVQNVFPNLVQTTNPTALTPDGTLTINYDGLIAPMIRAIQQLNAGFTLANPGSGATSTLASRYAGTTTPAISVDASGNVGIGLTDPHHALQVAGEVGAIGFVNTSTRDAKTGITYLTPEEASSTLAKLVELKPAQYLYKIEDAGDAPRLGFIAEDAAQVAPEILSADHKGVDLYKLATFTLTGVQELAARQALLGARVDSLEARIKKLEDGSITMASGSPISFSTSTLTSALSDLGILVQKGIAQFNTLVFNRLVAATDSSGTSAAGSGQILAGNTVAQITNAQVAPSTKVFITFNAQVTGPWWVSDKANGSFRVVLSAPQAADVSFDYFLVQTEGQLATSTPDGSFGSAAPVAGAASGSTPTSNLQPPTSSAPPVITLLGDSPVRLSVGGKYVEPGLSIRDASGANISTYMTFVNGVAFTGDLATLDTSVAATYAITYQATGSAGVSATAVRNVIVGNPIAPAAGTSINGPADTNPPTVILNDAPAIMIGKGDRFSDPGATAIDDVDGDLTKKIVVSGTVNTSVVGLYTLTYSATDKAGNTGHVSRVVTVQDPTGAATAPAPAVTTTATATTSTSTSNVTSATTATATSSTTSTPPASSTTTTPSDTTSSTAPASTATSSSTTSAPAPTDTTTSSSPSPSA